jgi:sugar phosphate isomerase/epimerase
MKKAIQISYDKNFEKKCEFAHDVGFRHIAVNFNDTPKPSDITYDKAPAHISAILEKYDLEAVQTHLYYYYPLSSADQIEEELEHRILREIEVSGKIGAPWCVWHPRYFKSGEWKNGTYDEEQTFYYNHETVPRYLEQAKKFGTGIALENLFGSMMYGGVDMLTRLCDRFHTDNVGICFDTGHANIDKEDLSAVISFFGDRIKCTHIHNNWGKRDDHAPPIYGNIEWERVMPALTSIGYQGPLTLETRCWYDDEAMLRSFAKHNYENLEYLERLMK